MPILTFSSFSFPTELVLSLFLVYMHPGIFMSCACLSFARCLQSNPPNKNGARTTIVVCSWSRIGANWILRGESNNETTISKQWKMVDIEACPPQKESGSTLFWQFLPLTCCTKGNRKDSSLNKVVVCLASWLDENNAHYSTWLDENKTHHSTWTIHMSN